MLGNRGGDDDGNLAREDEQYVFENGDMDRKLSIIRQRMIPFYAVQLFYIFGFLVALVEPMLLKGESQQNLHYGTGLLLFLWAILITSFPYSFGLPYHVGLMALVGAPIMLFTYEIRGENAMTVVWKDNYPVILSGLLLMFVLVLTYGSKMKDERARLAFFKSFSMEQMEARSDLLLKEMLPKLVLEEIMGEPNKTRIVRQFEDMVILFSDISGFTAYSKTVSAHEVVTLVTSLFSSIDDLSREVGVYKVCTIGDCYVAVPEPDLKETVWESSLKMMRFAFRLSDTIKEVCDKIEVDCSMRVGLHLGNYVGGVIGTTKLRYDIWGRDVSIANMMESNGVPGKINAHKDVDIGKNQTMPTFLVYPTEVWANMEREICQSGRRK